MVKQGYVVAAADVLGVGETFSTASRALSDGYTGVLIGRSVVGIQAGDMIRVVNYLKNRPDVDPSKLSAVAIDEMSIPLLHAAVFDPSIKSVILKGPLISYRSVIMNRNYKIGLIARENGGTHHPYEVDFSWGIAGVLKGYDLPDLIGCIAPRKIALVEISDQLLEPASPGLIDTELEFSRATYGFKKVPENIKLNPVDSALATLVAWSLK